MNQQLDEFRFAKRFKSESGAIRELIGIGLETLKKQQEQTAVERAA